eukprot:273230_1
MKHLKVALVNGYIRTHLNKYRMHHKCYLSELNEIIFRFYGEFQDYLTEVIYSSMGLNMKKILIRNHDQCKTYGLYATVNKWFSNRLKFDNQTSSSSILLNDAKQKYKAFIDIFDITAIQLQRYVSREKKTI